MQLKTFRSINLAEIPHSGFWIIHYLLLNAPAGAFVSFLSVVRAIGRCYLHAKFHNPSMFVCVVIVWGLTLYNYLGIQSLLPPIGFTIITFGMISERRDFLTNSIFLSYSLWLIYGLAVGSIFQVVASTLSITSLVIGKMRHEGFVFKRPAFALMPQFARPFPRATKQ
jgi:uncharacterized protein (DUF486 family)